MNRHLPNEAGSNRLAIYVLLDYSASSTPIFLQAALEAVERTLQAAHERHPQCPIVFTIIGFNTTAFQFFPLTPVQSMGLMRADARPGDLTPAGGSALGGALHLLEASMQAELFQIGRPGGDAVPAVFIFTDGEATDDWQSALEILNNVKLIVVHDDDIGLSSSFRERTVPYAQLYCRLNSLQKESAQLLDRAITQHEASLQMIAYPLDY